MKTLILVGLLNLLTFNLLSQDVSKVEMTTTDHCEFIINDTNVINIDYPMDGILVFPLTNPINFYLVDSKNKIIKFIKNTTAPSFNSDDLTYGIYYMVLEDESTKHIYKLIKQ
jgi:hypothetical protein